MLRVTGRGVRCAQVLPFDDNLCINEPCLNFEQCVSEQRFGNASSVVGTDSVMLRPLHMSSTITCTCPVGFTGTLVLIDGFIVIIVIVTSDQSNLTTGSIAAAHGRFIGIPQVAPVCTPT